MLSRPFWGVPNAIALLRRGVHITALYLGEFILHLLDTLWYDMIWIIWWTKRQGSIDLHTSTGLTTIGERNGQTTIRQSKKKIILQKKYNKKKKVVYCCRCINASSFVTLPTTHGRGRQLQSDEVAVQRSDTATARCAVWHVNLRREPNVAWSGSGGAGSTTLDGSLPSKTRCRRLPARR